jgi:hypothetical protein
VRNCWGRARLDRAERTGIAWLGPCALGLIVFTSCGGRGILDPPPPEFQPDVIIPPDAPPSTIGVPLAFPVSLLSDLLEEAVPTTYGTFDEMRVLPARGRTNVSLALERSPFHVTLVDDEARVATTLRYALRLSYGLPVLPDPSGSCGTDPERRPSLAVVIRSRVSLDSQWSLRTVVRLSDVRAASVTVVDRCEVSILDLDVTDRIVEGARTFIESHLGAIDNHAADVDTRSRFEKWWRTLQEPIELDDALWLSMRPESIRRGPVRGSGDSVRVELALTARPRIVYGSRPNEPLRPLPALDTGAVSPRLDLLVDARAEYGSASRFLVERLGGSELKLGDRSIRIDALRVFGIGAGLLALELRVTGTLRGRLYLTGSPTIDLATGQISVPDLEFDEATRDQLFPFLPELTALPLRDYLRERATWPSEPAVRWLSGWLVRGLNRSISDDLRVTGSVDTVQIVRAYALKDALLVRISAKGSASLFLAK